MKWVFVFGAVLVAISISFIKRSRNNVCSTFGDYYTDRDRNENCYCNPDGDLTVPEIVTRRGYSVETYNVTTTDGHILTLFRISNSKGAAAPKPRPPVFLQHTVRSNSKCFVDTGKKSLAFILTDKGYDVWLGNFRGTSYSRNHTYLTDENEKFWDYSFHEFGVYDVPAQIDFVNKITKQKIVFIGYSMGSTAAMIYSSTYPESARDKVKVFIALAPFIHTNGMNLFTRLGVKVWPFLSPVVQALTNGEYFTKRFSSISTAAWKFLCYPYPFQMKMCEIPDMLTFGIDYDQNDPETLPATVLHFTDTTSVKTMSHVAQLVSSESFQQFDYGPEENMKRYQTSKPPSYDLSKITVPTYIIRSDNDMLSPKEGIERFHAALPKDVKHDIYVIPYNKFNHIDYVRAKDVVQLCYNYVINLISNL